MQAFGITRKKTLYDPPRRSVWPESKEENEGQFIHGRFDNEAGERDYRLFIPPGAGDQPLPLLVMLHGCHQQPEDFAEATGMNRLAARQACFVLYPAQRTQANGGRCWNWYRPGDQQRDSGEPSIIAGMTRAVAAAHAVDARHIYVAGLSAGGAMATILGATWPELYAAVGIHSGLPYAAAHDMLSAFEVMRRGTGSGDTELPSGSGMPKPTIIFHGDRDVTVHPSNADGILEQLLAGGQSGKRSEWLESIQLEPGDFGHYGYTRTIRYDRHGRIRLERWLLHGAGHAWSGGNPGGTFSDPRGPDASKEMLRFFMSLREEGCCCERCK